MAAGGVKRGKTDGDDAVAAVVPAWGRRGVDTIAEAGACAITKNNTNMKSEAHNFFWSTSHQKWLHTATGCNIDGMANCGGRATDGVAAMRSI